MNANGAGPNGAPPGGFTGDDVANDVRTVYSIRPAKPRTNTLRSPAGVRTPAVCVTSLEGEEEEEYRDAGGGLQLSRF
eukprot:1160068-Pelagomonas_calceolata.AAC.2